MKTRLALFLTCALFTAPSLLAQSTAFTYQGRLSASGSPANNLYEMQFTLFDAVTNGNQVGLPVSIAPVPVSNGLFTVTLDFGATAFMGANRWLEITLNISGSDMASTTLHPRQPITPTPYALHAANAANLMSFANAPLDIKVNGQRALRLEPNATSPNVIGGFSGNVVSNGVVGGTIAGGGRAMGFQNRVGADFATVGGGQNNAANGISGTVGGGAANSVRVGARYSTVGGGAANEVWEDAMESVIGGGGENEIRTGASFSVIAGGKENTVNEGSVNATVGGGYSNHIEPNTTNGVIAGGFDNRILATSRSVTIGGGENNTSAGAYSTIAGGTWNTTSREYATIGGGRSNRIEAAFASIAGGTANWVQNGATWATIAGGNGSWVGGPLSTVAGGAANVIQTNISGATIGGGADNIIETGAHSATIAGGWFHTIWSNAYQATIGGGWGCTIQPDAHSSTIDGGLFNSIGSNSYSSVVGGGDENHVSPNSHHGVVAGGRRNIVYANSHYSVLSGGESNIASNDWATVGGGRLNVANGSLATISGGDENVASGDQATVGGGVDNKSTGPASTIGGGKQNSAAGESATIPGGYWNIADGSFSFAAGHRARANHDATFVWADFRGADFCSTTTNEFSVRATGGVRFVSAIDTNGSNISGITLAPGSGTWSSLSDRNAKENFAAANTREILDKVASLPLASWNYKAQDKSIRHLGPTAQDFHAAFGLGESDRTITTVDADGVALAAIQGLNQKLEEKLLAKDAELRSLKRQVDELRELVQSLVRNHAQ